MIPLQDTLDSLDIGVARFDRRLGLLAWNRTLFRMLDYPRRFAAEGTSFLQFVAFNIERGEHGPRPPELIVRDRLAHRYRDYTRRRANGSQIHVRSRRTGDGGFIKTFTLAPADAAVPGGMLSPREADALRWAAHGKTAAETAQIMGITARTVEFHLENAAARLGAVNKTHAVALALVRNFIAPPT